MQHSQVQQLHKDEISIESPQYYRNSLSRQFTELEIYSPSELQEQIQEEQ
jgi:hypothetical protein